MTPKELTAFLNWKRDVHALLPDVVAERERQLAKFGFQRHKLPVWTNILGEEVGELNKEVLNLEFGQPTPEARAKARAEAVQVAAVALAIVQYLDKDVA